MKRLILISIAICVLLAGEARCQSWSWSRTFNSDGGLNTLVTSLLSDKEGNVFAIGKFSQNLTLSKTYAGIGIFFVKMDHQGKILWEKVYTSNPVQYPSVNAVQDSLGNFYVLGYCDHDLISENTDKINAGTFLLKFDKDGHLLKDNLLIAQEVTTCISSSGSYITSVLKSYGNVQVKNTTISDKGNLIIQTDTAGNLLWFKSFPTLLQVRSSTTGADGSVLITGSFQDSVTYENQKIKSAGDKDAFLLKVDRGGRLRWLYGYGQKGFDQGLGVTYDFHGNIYVAGDKTYNAFNTNLASESSFISQLDSTGKVIWGKETGDPALLFPVSRSIVVDAMDHIYLNGEYKENLYLNWSGPGISLPHSGGEDVYAGMLPDAAGVEWGLAVYGSGDEKSTSMLVDNKGNVGLAGIFTDSVIVGKDSYTGMGIFIAKSFSNQLPEVQTFTAKSAIVNIAYELVIYAQDTDSDSLFATISGLPPGFTLSRIDPKTFVIKGTASAGEEGQYNVSLHVSDLYSIVESDFVISIVSEGTSLPLELVYSSIPLTGGRITDPDKTITYQFSNPVKPSSLIFQIGTQYTASWSADGTTLTLILENLQDTTNYSGFISLTDSLGNSFSNNIGFTTSFSISAVMVQEDDPLIGNICFDLQGRIISPDEPNKKQTIVIRRSIYRSGKVVVEKFLYTD